ncbi:hypothetical protein I7I48_02201 [Histoplasma ohiense]|nr:hypothetical protein I7I48_02201 [Histoplasma ohiense (nom. inval.)]
MASVWRFRKPNWSSFPYSPHAENRGSPLFKGRSENLAFWGFSFSSSHILVALRILGMENGVYRSSGYIVTLAG